MQYLQSDSGGVIYSFTVLAYSIEFLHFLQYVFTKIYPKRLIQFHFVPEKYAKKLQPCLLLESLELPQNSRLPSPDVSFWLWLFRSSGWSPGRLWHEQRGDTGK